MILQLSKADPLKSKIEALVIPVCQDRHLHTATGIRALIKSAKAQPEFSGDKDERLIFYQPSETRIQRLIFLGLGKFDNIDPEALRRLSAKAVKRVLPMGIAVLSILLPDSKKLQKISIKDRIAAMAEGAYLANTQFDVYKRPKHPSLKRIKLLVGSHATRSQRTALQQIEAVCEGTALARRWVNLAANDKTPPTLARLIAKAAKTVGLSVEIWEEKRLRKEGFGALLAVAAGSDHPPRMVVLDHDPNPKGKTQPLMLVGKGVTFDTGGINLKPGTGLDTMKCDMAGAAAVAAAVISAAKRKLKRRVIGVIPIVENMPSGKATRPGDIITTWAGKTVEIGNTDAEGRLILIDAMAWGIKAYAPGTVIDLATLTGACVVALGEQIAGVFTDDDILAEALISAGSTSYERCWRLPLPADYKDLLKSEFADLNNMGSTRWGGAITAALFLKEFVGDTRWAHIDIAGPAYHKKAGTYSGAGGTGFGVRLLHRFMDSL